MTSIRLVILSLVLGIAIGAGLMTARQSEGSRKSMAISSSHVPTHDPRAEASAKRSKPGVAPDDGYQRVANALLSIDERLSLMEAREESNMEKQNKLVDQVRDLALALEIKSGNLKPLRSDRSARLEPVRALPKTEPETRARAVPLAQPHEPRVPPGAEELPEW